MNNQKNRIGIIGGSFNPIHIGHLLLAQEAMERQGLDEVWLIPAGQPYMKEASLEEGELIAAAERYRMTELAVAGRRDFKCLDIEIKRKGATYSYETFEQLRALYPEYSFFFILGADCLFSIENWKCPERLFASCSVIAAVRSDADKGAMEHKIEELKHRFGADIMLLDFLRMEISSTDIRERVRGGRSIRYLVPDSVLAYIKEKKLYQI